jgi:tRNA(Ile)-lysidine synthase
MNDKVLTAIKHYNMLSPGDHLAVGLSGGADSVALLHVLRGMAEELGLTITALHLNHQLRGGESNRDEAFVRRLCWDWHVRLLVKSAPVAELARRGGQSVEACARDIRYDFFRRSASGKVATAHTLSDSAETVLLNLMRGTALRGLAGIPPVRGNVVRPLILCSRAEVEAYCERHGLDYVTDSTNLDDAFTRNRIRHDVTPVLAELNPGFLNCVAGMTDALREDADYLDGLAADTLQTARRDKNRYDRAAILSQPRPILMRAILLLLRERDIPVDRKRLEQVRELLSETSGGVQLSGKWICRVTENELLFASAVTRNRINFPPISIEAPYKDSIIPIRPGKTLYITVDLAEVFNQKSNNLELLFQNALDCDKIGRLVRLRQREPGDSIRLAGRGLTKSLKKLMNEESIPIERRNDVLVLAGEDGVLWVEGFGVTESAAASKNTERILVIRVVEE